MYGIGLKVPVNRFILYALDTAFIAVSLVLQLYNADNIIWTIVGLAIFNIIFASNKEKNRMSYMLFTITYFTFLLSRLVVLRMEG